MSNEELGRDAEKLRHRLETDTELKARLDGLRAMLDQHGYPDEGDDDVITLLVSEALDGVDLQARYPQAFARLLQSPDQQELFLAALESFEADTAEIASATPAITADLPSRAQLQRASEPGTWEARWALAAHTLQALFQPAELVYRDGTEDEEERWITLLRDELAVGDYRAAIVLDGRFTDKGSLEPQLKLAVEQDGREVLFEAWGELSWGQYRTLLERTGSYRNRLPSVALNDLLSPESFTVQAALDLTLNFRFSESP